MDADPDAVADRAAYCEAKRHMRMYVHTDNDPNQDSHGDSDANPGRAVGPTD